MEDGLIFTFQNSLHYLTYVLLFIGIIWSLYGFFVQKDKEAAFKRLLATAIGASIILVFSYFVGSIFTYVSSTDMVQNKTYNKILWG